MDHRNIVYTASSVFNLKAFEHKHFQAKPWHHAIITGQGLVVFVWDTREIVAYFPLTKLELAKYWENLREDSPERAVDNHQKLKVSDAIRNYQSDHILMNDLLTDKAKIK